MKILGIGVDIIENKRIKKSLKNSNFKKRIYSHKEIRLSVKSINKVSFFSKRFAGKEAFWKAFSPSQDLVLHFNEIEILSKRNGKPYLNLIGKTKTRIKDFEKSLNGTFNYHISLSDEKPNAIAFVIIFLAQVNSVLHKENKKRL